jgi:hypothetical protein
MTTIRRRLRLSVAAWLVFQVVSLSAFVPHACCIAHQPGTEQKVADDSTCPLHTAGHEAAEEPPNDACSMRAMCDGPMAAILALLSNQGVLTDALSISPNLKPGSTAPRSPENLITRLASPNPPPPRA